MNSAGPRDANGSLFSAAVKQIRVVVWYYKAVSLQTIAYVQVHWVFALVFCGAGFLSLVSWTKCVEPRLTETTMRFFNIGQSIDPLAGVMWLALVQSTFTLLFAGPLVFHIWNTFKESATLQLIRQRTPGHASSAFVLTVDSFLLCVLCVDLVFAAAIWLPFLRLIPVEAVAALLCTRALAITATVAASGLWVSLKLKANASHRRAPSLFLLSSAYYAFMLWCAWFLAREAAKVLAAVKGKAPTYDMSPLLRHLGKLLYLIVDPSNLMVVVLAALLFSILSMGIMVYALSCSIRCYAEGD